MDPTEARVRRRAHQLTAEEKSAGSDDALAQARQILLESDLREAGGGSAFIEHRTSDETVPPSACEQ